MRVDGEREGGEEGGEGWFEKRERPDGAVMDGDEGDGREGCADLRLCPLVWGMEREKDSQKSLCMVWRF